MVGVVGEVMAWIIAGVMAGVMSLLTGGSATSGVSDVSHYEMYCSHLFLCSILHDVLSEFLAALCCNRMPYLSNCQAENSGDSVFLNFGKPWLKTPTPTARILSYLSSAQQDIFGEPQENIRKPLIAILTLNFGTKNTGVSREIWET